jgi:hypothetical protein
MNARLATRRKLYIACYSRYLDADRAWSDALRAASELVSDVVGHGYWRLGAPRSRLRRLYVERDRALQRMMAAHLELESEKHRLLAKRQRQILLLA